MDLSIKTVGHQTLTSDDVRSQVTMDEKQCTIKLTERDVKCTSEVNDNMSQKLVRPIAKNIKEKERNRMRYKVKYKNDPTPEWVPANVMPTQILIDFNVEQHRASMQRSLAKLRVNNDEDNNIIRT